MKKSTAYILLIVLMVVTIFVACHQQPKTNSPEVIESDTYADFFGSVAKAEGNLSPEVKAAQRDFALRMLKAVHGENPEENVVISAQSISTALGMTYMGAQGQTEAEMAKVLGLEGLDKVAVASGYKQMAEAMTRSGDSKVKNANAIWVDEGFPLVKGFVDVMKGSFQAPVNSMDLQSDKAVPTINGWIKDNTDSMIDKLFTEPFTQDTSVVLCNAIIFDGQWTTPFESNRIFDRTFHGKEDQAVRIMYQDDDYMGKDGEGYRAVMIPYGEDERFQMVGVLPEGDMLSFLDDLDAETYASFFEGYEEQSDVTVGIPVMTLDEKIDLKETLSAMGMPTAFTQEADFAAMGDDLFIGKVLHRAKIEMDEKGTKAAAISAIEAPACAEPPEDPWEFIADRPFLFFIYDSENDLVLFSAKVLEV